MEPEKIDALFRQKMENFQKTPSADAWAKLQSRIEPPKKEEKKVMWLYYVAASVMLVLVSGVLWIANRNESGSGSQMATTTKTEIQKPAVLQPDAAILEKETQIAANQKDSKPADAPAEAAGKDPEKAALNQPENQARQLASTGKSNGSRKKDRSEKPVFEKDAAMERAIARQKEKQLKDQLTKPENQVMLADNRTKETTAPAMPAVKRETLEILIIKDAPEPELLAVNETSEPAEEDQKLTKFELAKNIGKQLLNLKRGEKIDRTELGLPENYTVALETKILKQKINKTINL